MAKPVDKIFKEDVIPAVVQTVRTSGSLKGQDIGFHKSLDPAIKESSDAVSSRLMEVSKELIESITNEDIELQDDPEIRGSNWKIVSDALDTLFERADVLFDEIKTGTQTDNHKKFTYLEESNNGSTDDSKNIGKKMEKPQLQFKTPVDNEELNPFKPKITEKPNSLQPFEESVQLVQPGKIDDSELIDPPYYPHPYQYEIDNQPYPDSILSKSEPIPSQPWDSDNLEWVSTPEQVSKMVEELSKSSEIAVDLEHHDYRTYYGLVCLMQISNREKDWIVDTLALRDDLKPLNKVFTNPNIVKVFHGAFMDIIWLQRDLGLYIVSLFDTYHASRKLGFPKFSLAYLLETFAHFKTSKKYQLADWRIRPLSKPMLAYARSDTHFLLNIFDQLKNKLLEKEDDKLQEVLYESRKVAKRRFEYTKYRPLNQNSSNLVTCPVMSSNPREPYLPIVIQYNIQYHVKPVVEVLYNWRDRLARDLDESVRYIMSNQALALIATIPKPVDAKKILNIPTFITDFVRKNAAELARLINDTLDQLESSDWDLVDKVNDNSMASYSKNLISDASPASVATQNQIFSELCEENLIMLEHKAPHISKHVESKLFTTNEDILAVKFGKSVINITLNELPERIDYKAKEFERLYNFEQSEIVANESPSDVAEIQEDTPKSEPAPQPVPAKEEIKESKDDIITLRKPKKQRNKGFKRSHESDEPVLNYEEMDSIMTGKTDEKFKSKKRKFDPYSQSGTGPKAARKQKQFHNGRSSTFKK